MRTLLTCNSYFTFELIYELIFFNIDRKTLKEYISNIYAADFRAIIIISIILLLKEENMNMTSFPMINWR